MQHRHMSKAYRKQLVLIFMIQLSQAAVYYEIYTPVVFFKTHVLIGGAFIHIEAVKNIKKQNSLLYLQLVGWTFLER